MKLIYLLQRESWFIDCSGAWAPLQDSKSIDLAVSVLPLVTINEFDIVEQPLQLGEATLAQISDEQVKISILKIDGSPHTDEILSIDMDRLWSSEWAEKPFDDGWLQSDARLVVDNVRKMALKIYLPPVEGSDGKALSIKSSSKESDAETVESVFLRRGEENEVVIIDQQEPLGREVTLSCEAEASNDSSDVRKLGFLLLDKVVEL